MPATGMSVAKPPVTQPRLSAAGSPAAGSPAANAPVIISETPAPLIKNLSDLQSLSPEISYRYHSIDLTDFAILDAHSQLELEAPLETRREAPKLSFREPSEKAAPLLTRVVREVKYIVNGEKPDLDRAGVKPTAIAFAQNPDGLLANESRQIREGIHKFKEIFR